MHYAMIKKSTDSEQRVLFAGAKTKCESTLEGYISAATDLLPYRRTLGGDKPLGVTRLTAEGLPSIDLWVYEYK